MWRRNFIFIDLLGFIMQEQASTVNSTPVCVGDLDFCPCKPVSAISLDLQFVCFSYLDGKGV